MLLGFIDYRRLDYLREIFMVLVNEYIYGDKFSDKEKEKMVVKCNKLSGIIKTMTTNRIIEIINFDNGNP